MGLAEEEVLIRDDSGLLLEGEAKVPRSKKCQLTKTLCLSTGFLVLGLCVAIPGPTLLDLCDQVKATTAQIMIVFASRSVGYLLGAIMGGFLFDCFNKQLLLFCTLLVAGVASMAIPWSLTLVVMATMFAFQGITMGTLETGGNVFCLQLWGKKSGPYVQTLHFAFGIGAFIAPLLAKPFLATSALTANGTEVVYGNIPVPVYFHNLSKRSLDIDHNLDLGVFDDRWQGAAYRHIQNHVHKRPVNEPGNNIAVVAEINPSNSTETTGSTDYISGITDIADDIPGNSQTESLNNISSSINETSSLNNAIDFNWTTVSVTITSTLPTSQIPDLPRPKKPSAATDKKLKTDTADGKQVKEHLENVHENSANGNEHIEHKLEDKTSITTSRNNVNGEGHALDTSTITNIDKEANITGIGKDQSHNITDAMPLLQTQMEVNETKDAFMGSLTNYITTLPIMEQSKLSVTEAARSLTSETTMGAVTSTGTVTMTISSMIVASSSATTATHILTTTIAPTDTTKGAIPTTAILRELLVTAGQIFSGAVGDTKIGINTTDIISTVAMDSSQVSHFSITPSFPILNVTLTSNMSSSLSSTWPKEEVTKPQSTGNSFLNKTLQVVKDISRIQFAYLIIGLALLVNAIMFLVMYCRDRKWISTTRDSEGIEKMYIDRTCVKAILIALQGLFLFCYIGTEVTFGALVTTFAVKFNHWPQSRGAIVAAIFWGSLAAGRGLAIFIACFSGPTLMLTMDLLFMNVGALVLAIGVHFYDWSLWLGTFILGLGMSSVFPTAITWANDHFLVTGKIITVFMLNSSLGQVIFPMVTGYLFEIIGAVVLMYITLALSISAITLFFIMQCVASRMGSRHVFRDTIGFMPLDADDDDDENINMVHFEKTQSQARLRKKVSENKEFFTQISDLEDD